MKQGVKIAVVVVIAAALAAGGAAWKWRAPTVKGNQSYKIAGWSWGSGHIRVTRHTEDDDLDGAFAIGQDA